MRQDKNCVPPKRSLGQPSARWRAFEKPLTMPKIVGLVTIVLCCCACATARKTTPAQKDSYCRTSDTVVSRVQRVSLRPVPQEQAQLTLALDSLRALPQGAVFRAEKGRATVVVERRRDTVVVWALCDSLWQRCEYYEQVVAHLQEEVAQHELRTTVERSSKGLRKWLEGFVVGLMAALVGGGLIRLLLKV